MNKKVPRIYRMNSSNEKMQNTATTKQNTPVKTEKEEKEWERFAELRRQFREKNPGPHEDDWLDDEQWYCEHAAEWGPPIHVPTDIFRDPVRLKQFLENKTNDSGGKE